MIIIDCAQGSPEWHQARSGAITASMFSTCRDRYKSGKDKGDFKSAAKDYAFTLAVERMTGAPLEGSDFQTWQMRRGNELEPEARDLHIRRTGLFVERAGIVKTDDGKFGASADGLIDLDGGSEYKCLVSAERLRHVLMDCQLDDFTDQVQGCMWLTGRKWWHLCFYCPSLEPIGMDLTIHEVKRDEEYIGQLEADLLAFDALVEQYRERLTMAKAA